MAAAPTDVKTDPITQEPKLSVPSEREMTHSASTAPSTTRRLSVRDSIRRTLSSPSAKQGGEMLKSLGSVAIGSHPLWLMGEAISGKKVGTKARKGGKDLVAASVAFSESLSTSANDILVIINEQLREKGKETTETANVIKEAGDRAIVVVTSSLVKAKDQMESNSPAIKRSILKNGKEVIIVIDKSLKNPIVITGIRKFARSKGIPGSEAMMTLASLALSKLLAHVEQMEGELQDGIHELDAELLDKNSTKEAQKEAKEVQEQLEKGKTEKEEKKDKSCIIV